MRFVKPNSGTLPTTIGEGSGWSEARQRVQQVREGKLKPIDERWPKLCQIQECTRKWYTLIETRWLPKEITPEEGLYVCEQHWHWLQSRHGRIMSYRYENGRTIKYVTQELF